MTPETTSTAKSRLFDPLLNKDFRAYFIGQSISSFGDGIVPVTFAFAALAVSPDGTGMPAVLLGLWISRMAFIGLGGHAGQRVNRALVMLIADAVRLIAQLGVALVFIFGEPAIWHLVLSAVIYGIGTAFFVPSSVGLLPRLISRGELQQANSLLGIVSNSAFLIGPALAALLVLAGGVQTALLVDAGTFLISMAALTTILRGAHSPPDGWRDPALEAAESAMLSAAPESQFALTDAYRGPVGILRLIHRFRSVFWIVTLFCFANLGISAITVLGPVIALESLGGTDRWAILATAMAAGALTGSFLAGIMRVQRPIAVILMLLAVLVPLNLLALGAPAPLLVIAVTAAASAIGLSIGGVLFETYLQTDVPDSLVPRISSIEDAVTSSMIPIGIAISLPMARLMGFDAFLGLLAVATALAGICGGMDLWLTRRPRRKAEPDALPAFDAGRSAS